uniref:exodeoxyribonuclease III n=1 Tax=Stegastes partitus TaxID=144197 RepID=A0A3B4ZHM5_9TELE
MFLTSEPLTQDHHKAGMSSQIGLIRLSTWNVNGLGNPIKRKKVMTMLKNKNHDVVFLQETHMSKEESEKLCVGWVGHVFYSIGSSKSKGVIILVNNYSLSVSGKLRTWEALKAVIRGRIIQHTSYQKKIKTQELSPAGDLLTATTDINQAFKEFYNNLYSSTSSSN